VPGKIDDVRWFELDEAPTSVGEEEKILIITDADWRNYLPAVLTKKPVLVYNSTEKFIDIFISQYRPNKILQLGIHLDLENSYQVESPEMLIKLFYGNYDIMPSDKKLLILNALLDAPNYEYSLEEIEENFRQKNPRADYFVLTDPNSEISMFAATLAKRRNGFIVFSEGDANGGLTNLTQKIKSFDLPSSYIFDQNIYLTLLGVPYFIVNDPVDELFNDDGNKLLTDSPYGDINGDGFLDLSVGRIEGSPESISYQIEYSRFLKEEKTALILASYNMAGKHSDVMVSGGTMPYVFDVEIELLNKNFNTKRLVERRADFNEVNFTILHDISDMIDKFHVEYQAGASTFSGLLSNLMQIFLVTKIGDTMLYAIYEFDWSDTWESIFDLDPHFPKRLPILNSINVMGYVPESQTIIYFSKGNSTHWFLPVNSTMFETYYDEFDPSVLPLGPKFYYVQYSNSIDMGEKLTDVGALATISSTGNSHFMYSGFTANEFFKSFDSPVGKALKLAKNENLELEGLYDHPIYDFKSPGNYRKEYYIRTLLGDPALVFDPNLNLRQSNKIEVENETLTANFPIESTHFIYNNSLIFDNMGGHILEPNKPIVPYYKKLLLLPSESDVINVSLEILSSKNYQNVSIDVLIPDPEFFNISNFTGTFPKISYWYQTVDLLDGRKTLDAFFIPVIYNSDNSAVVLETANIKITYTALLEIIDIHSRDVSQNETATISVDVFNNLKENTTIDLKIKIENENFQEMFNRSHVLGLGVNNLIIYYNNTNQTGNYSVSSSITHDDIIVGPKYTHFQVREFVYECELCKYPVIRHVFDGISGFSHEVINFFNTLMIKETETESITSFISKNVSLYINQTNDSTRIKLLLKDRKLLVDIGPGSINKTLISPFGSLKIFETNENITEDGVGDIDMLRQLMNGAILVYEKELSKLNVEISTIRRQF